MQWISVFSLLFGSGILVTAWKYLYNRVKANDQKSDALQKGVQALLRDRLVAEYNKYSEKEYAPIYVKENFENMWTQYHNLGKNGVMDDLHKKFMELPTEKGGYNEH